MVLRNLGRVFHGMVGVFVTVCGGDFSLFPLIRHRLRRRHLPPPGGKAYRCAYRYYCAVMQVPVSEAFPLTGEGGTAGGGDG